jgi:hypothetical protein
MTIVGGRRWHSWLRHCATSLKVAGSIPDSVIGILIIVKAAVAENRQTYYINALIAWKSGRFNPREPQGPVRTCTGIALPL